MRKHVEHARAVAEAAEVWIDDELGCASRIESRTDPVALAVELPQEFARTVCELNESAVGKGRRTVGRGRSNDQVIQLGGVGHASKVTALRRGS
jgi:hypothetical protein